MLENLINLVKENAGDAIINNPAIPNEQNDDAIATTAGGIMDGLKNQLSSGRLESITGMFQQGGNVANNPAMSGISQNVVGQLMQKFGLDSGAAGGIVASLLPTVMGKLVNKTNDPNDSSFDLGGIMSSLGGSGGIGCMLGGLGKMFG